MVTQLVVVCQLVITYKKIDIINQIYIISIIILLIFHMQTLNKVGYVYDPIMTLHQSPLETTHPERPERILEIYKYLLNRNLIHKMVPIRTREATIEELLKGHTSDYINMLEWKLRGPKGVLNQISEQYNSVYVNEHTMECAKIAAGSVIDLAKKVNSKSLDSGVAIVRPPGHHAERNGAMGFCIYGTVGITSKILADLGSKVLIVDFDIHAGNGTEDIVKGDPRIMFFSVHKYDRGCFYPHNLLATSKYKDLHKLDTRSSSNIINVDLNGVVTNVEYIRAFENVLIPRSKEFNPDIVLVSAGFDGLDEDPIGGSHLTVKVYRDLMSTIKQISSSIVMVLEGGYHLEKVAEAFGVCTEVLLGI